MDVYEIDIVETRPSGIIKIVDVNLEVDFEQPLDYVELKRKMFQKDNYSNEL